MDTISIAKGTLVCTCGVCVPTTPSHYEDTFHLQTKTWTSHAILVRESSVVRLSRHLSTMAPDIRWDDETKQFIRAVLDEISLTQLDRIVSWTNVAERMEAGSSGRDVRIQFRTILYKDRGGGGEARSSSADNNDNNDEDNNESPTADRNPTDLEVISSANYNRIIINNNAALPPKTKPPPPSLPPHLHLLHPNLCLPKVSASRSSTRCFAPWSSSTPSWNQLKSPTPTPSTGPGYPEIRTPHPDIPLNRRTSGYEDAAAQECERVLARDGPGRWVGCEGTGVGLDGSGWADV